MVKKTKGAKATVPTTKAHKPTYDELVSTLTKMTSHKNGRAPKQLFFDEVWLAARWGLTDKAMQNWRYEKKGAGPAFYKLKGAVRYRLRDIVAFEKKCRTPSGGGGEDQS